MPPIHTPFVSIALARLRRGVNVCCWIIAVSLIVQLLVWCTATFTQVRFTRLEEKSKPDAIIMAGDPIGQSSSVAGSLRTPLAQSWKMGASAESIDVNRVVSPADSLMSKVSSLALCAGTVAMVMLIPLLAMGTLLGVGSATIGVELSISAFIWSLVLGIFVLPLAQPLNLPWSEGALASYAMMTNQVELAQSGGEQAWASATFYARFALLPIVCIAGVAIVGLRFNSGVNAGIVPKENMRLDPVLEKEAANIKASSLHGGRAGNAMRVASAAAATERTITPAAPAPVAASASVMQLSAGVAPRRLI